jgi:hypothetical protein
MQRILPYTQSLNLPYTQLNQDRPMEQQYFTSQMWEQALGPSGDSERLMKKTTGSSLTFEDNDSHYLNAKEKHEIIKPIVMKNVIAPLPNYAYA